MRPKEVFLSHAHADHAFALRVANVLVAHGVPVWYAETEIVGAQQWHDEIGRALRRCDWFLVLLTPHAVASRWVKHELLYALRKEQYTDRILPILHLPCEPDDLSWTLDAMQRIDLAGDFDQGCRDLLRVWGLGLRS